MEEKNTFTIIDDFGNEIECEVLFTYEHEKTGKNYIAYTDHSIDKEGYTKVYASVFNPSEDEPTLQQIETEKEWTMIEEILEEICNI